MGPLGSRGSDIAFASQPAPAPWLWPRALLRPLCRPEQSCPWACMTAVSRNGPRGYWRSSALHVDVLRSFVSSGAILPIHVVLPRLRPLIRFHLLAGGASTPTAKQWDSPWPRAPCCLRASSARLSQWKAVAGRWLGYAWGAIFARRLGWAPGPPPAAATALAPLAEAPRGAGRGLVGKG